MNSEEVIKVIEVTCERLGIAISSVAEIIPELAKYEISLGIFWSLISLIVIAVSVFAIKKTIYSANSKIKEESITDAYGAIKESLTEFPSVWVASIIGGLLIFWYAITLFSALENVVRWIVSPQASAIEYVLNLVR